MAIFKWHDFWDSDNHLLTPLLACIMIGRSSLLVIERIFENPLYSKQMDSNQKMAVVISLLELSVLVSICLSCAIFSAIRIIFGKKITYPKIYASNKSADFLLKYLGELEMFCTILTPALAGLFLAIFWPSSFDEFSDPKDQESAIALLYVTSSIGFIQAILPFI